MAFFGRFAKLVFAVSLCAMLTLVSSGCGKSRYPLSGKILYDDGTPYTGGGIVVLEGVVDGMSVMTRALINPDGTFVTSSGRSGGAMAGKYRVRLAPPPPELAPPPEDPDAPETVRGSAPKEAVARFDKKFLRFETSGIEWTIGSGQVQQPLEIRLGPPPATQR